MNKLVDSFKDFYSIESKEIFPKQLIVEQIWPSLSLLQKESIRDKPFYRNSNEYKKLNDNMGYMFQTTCSQMDTIDEEENENESDELSRSFQALSSQPQVQTWKYLF